MPIAANTSNHRSATKPAAPKGAGFGRAAATTPVSANPKTDASAAQPPPKPVSQLQPKSQAQAQSQAKDQTESRSDAKHSPKLNAAEPSAVHPPAAAAGAAAVDGAVPAAPAVTRQRVVVKSLKAVGPAGGAAKWGDEPDAKRKPQPPQPQVPGAAAAAKPPASADAKGASGAAADAKGASGAAVDDADSAVCGDERLKGITEVKTFDDLKLNEKLLRGVFAYGYEVPSVIQAKGIPALVLGHDTIAQAQSGTGKTATFCIGALQRLSVNIALKQSQVLVLSPTRELAQQTFRVCRALGDYLAPTVHLCVGGTHTAADRAALSGPNAAQVVIGTPGRVLHLLNSNGLKAKALTMLVVDEADEMLSAGFQEQMYGVFERLPKDIQICLFSATLTDECMALADKFMRNPVRLTIKREDVTLEGIKQFFVDVTGDANQAVARGGGRRQQQADDNAKLQVLCDLYESMSVSQCIVYANSRARVEWLADALNAEDFTVSALHAQLEPPEREAVMSRFRTGASRVLIATDLIARGIDVHGVSLVVNFDLPIARENYIHRIGRSGRFGRKGVAINFVAHRDDVAALRQLETFYATAINELPANVKDLMG